MTRQEKTKLSLEILLKSHETAIYKVIQEAYTRGYIDGLDAAAEIVNKDVPSILKPQAN